MDTSQRKRIGYYIKRNDSILDFCIHKSDFDQVCKDEFDKYCKIIFQLQPIVIAYEAVSLSYYELRKSLDDYDNIWLEKSIPGAGYFCIAISHLIESTQKVTNLLSSVTAFLASTQIRLKKEVGEVDPRYILWDSLRKKLHNENFSYRFLYELRNYSQHSNVPISEANVHIDDIVSDTRKVKSTLYINKIELFNSGYEWKKGLKLEIQAQDNKINLMPLVDEYIFIIKALTIAYLDLFQNDLTECYQYINTFYRVYNIPKDVIPLLFIGDTVNGQPVPNNMEYIPSEQLLWIFNKYKEIKVRN